jgi:hypothetical protein
LFGTAPGQQDYIKRVIGVPGDHVACCTKGKITVNGVPLAEGSYLFPDDAPSLTNFSITVPAGRLWVMGDHRFVSYDSRGHQQDPGDGTIPESQVVGRAFMIVWPPSRWRVLPIPATFGQPGVTSGKPATGAALRSGSSPATVSPAALGQVIVKPSAPLLPLELGFAGAVPLTWLQRRVRLRPRKAAQGQGRGRDRRLRLRAGRAAQGPSRRRDRERRLGLRAGRASQFPGDDGQDRGRGLRLRTRESDQSRATAGERELRFRLRPGGAGPGRSLPRRRGPAR